MEKRVPDADQVKFKGDGEMVEAVNRKDWSQTLLGPSSEWPSCIRAAVSLSLGSRFQLAVLAGPELVYVYNDAVIPIFGEKHPAALGQRVQDVWPEAWDTLGPILLSVMASGRSTWHDDLVLMLNRAGFNEECYFTVSYSPIFGDDDQVAGVFVSTIETTKRVLSERRQRTLGELATRLAQRTAAECSLELVPDVLSANLHALPLTVLYLFDPDDGHADRVFCCGLQSAAEPFPRRLDCAVGPTGRALHPLARLALSTEPCVLDAAAVLGPDDRCGIQGEQPRTLLAVPLVLPGQSGPRGFLIAGTDPHAHLDDVHRCFIQTVAGIVTTAVAGADAIEAARRHAVASAELDQSRSQFSALNREVEVVRDDLARVMAGTSDAFISFDEALHIRTLNAAAMDLFGQPRHEIIGAQLYDVAPHLRNTEFARELKEALASREPRMLEHVHVESGRWFHVRMVPAPHGVASFATDITVRKEAEQALKRANANLERRVQERSEELRAAMQLLAAVFDRAPGGIAITDTNNRFVRVNPAYAAMLGYKPEALMGRRFCDLVEPDDLADATPRFERLLAGELVFCEAEMRFRHARGDCIWVLSFISVIEDEQQRPRYTVHISNDITGRRRIEAERRAAQEELNVLYQRLETVREAERVALAREVHDQLGQILSAAKIDLRLLEDNIMHGSEAMTPDQLAQELRSASSTLDRGLMMVRQIATELRAPELDGQGLYAAIEWHARDFERRTRIVADLDLGTGLPQPALPASQALLRIFQEALTNVLRHAHATEVRITLELRGPRLLLRVCDDGVGIVRSVARMAGSLGLTGMAERAQLVRGRLLVGPIRPRGTLVSVLVPIDGGATPGASEVNEENQ